MQLEREIKFHLPPEAQRSLSRVVRAASSWRHRELSSVYYDTREGQLRRAGIALRTRRDGVRWLQTLKADGGVGGGFSTRAEWEIPAPRGRLDVAAFPRKEILAATGIDIVKLAPRLRPVFETRFERRAAMIRIGGATRAEIAVDRGYVDAGPRREPIEELELELKAGDSAAMLRYAADLAAPLNLTLAYESKAERGYRLVAGKGAAPPRKWRSPALSAFSGPAEAFAVIFNAALAQAGENARGVTQGRDPEYLHQMRVGLRRLRSALLAFRDLVPRETTKPLLRPLRQLVPPLGAARDWDVFCDRIERVVRQTPSSASVMGQLLVRARTRRATARRHARDAAASRRLQAFLIEALVWLHRAPWTTRAARIESDFSRFAAKSLQHLRRKALKQSEGIDWRDAAQRHRLRIRMKRLRYACDFFAGGFAEGAARRYVKRLAALQDILGDLNDIAVERRLLAKLAPRGAAASFLDAAAYVRRSLVARERRLIAALAPAWRAFEKQEAFWEPRG
ncbi:MAG TPA: CHAD domain-containing protein [Burkholderiales bacterium]|nr:CHAD domain-containing protein [Burkholderiales bacterium]